MKLPLSWLREFVQIDADADEISHRLSIAGLEVENIERLTPGFAGVTVAPNPDRRTPSQRRSAQPVRSRRRRIGPFQGRMRSAQCAARNGRAAGPGGRAPGRIGAQAARRQPSRSTTSRRCRPPRSAACARRGCSVRAASWACREDHSGILELEHDAPLGGDFARYLELDETIFDVAITPNRGDCLSILGLAREVSALFGAEAEGAAVPRRARWRTANAPISRSMPPTSAGVMPVSRWAGFESGSRRSGCAAGWNCAACARSTTWST